MEGEQTQRILDSTIGFMRKLLDAGCSHEFVRWQGFRYAMIKQWEAEHVIEHLSDDQPNPMIRIPDFEAKAKERDE